jgi:hypothetical protein
MHPIRICGNAMLDTGHLFPAIGPPDEQALA